MVEVWWSLIGTTISVLLTGQAFRIKRRRDEEHKIKTARGRERSTDDIFVCERVCTSKRMLKKRRTKSSLQKWAAEIAEKGGFSAPLGSGGPGELPVPYIVIGNKADIGPKDGSSSSSGNLVDVACHWVEKQGLLPFSEEILLTETFLGSGGLLAAAKEARYDKEAVMKFFRMLIRRRYFLDDLPAVNPWSTPVQRTLHRSSENLRDQDHSYDSTSSSSFAGDPYKYNILPPLPAQRNLTPPPTLYPQQAVSILPDSTNNYTINPQPRFSFTGSQETSSSSSAWSKRTDINV